MDLDHFLQRFLATFPEDRHERPAPAGDFADPCPDVTGMASPRKLQLLNLAVSCLPEDGSECYFEVGTYQGKSLIAALLGQRHCSVVACDNFSEFGSSSATDNATTLRANLERHGLADQVRFYAEDFQTLLPRWAAAGLPRIGVYFYDGAHDELSHYAAIRSAETLLADAAVVVIDDWRQAPDSQSYAEAGTQRALRESAHDWNVRWVLPARYNGDRELWWNGVAVLTFRRRRPESSRTIVEACPWKSAVGADGPAQVPR
ncbi:MAG: class I SAM-dependent methyltransferase [Planctomycetia bacterium]|nr:class I SAM-dependent methyltransferase [Planctomycetia bacterium]